MANLSALFLADREDGLCRRNVVSGTILNLISARLETFGKVLLRLRQSVSVTHQFIVADLEDPAIQIRVDSQRDGTSCSLALRNSD